MTDWRDDVSEEFPTVGLGDVSDDPVTVTFEGEGEMTETKHGNALRLQATYESGPDDYTDLNGSDIETGSTVYIMSSSSRFMLALKEYADTLEGETVEITASGDEFERHYTVSEA